MLYGSATHQTDLPHHLGGLTFWNYEHHGNVSILRGQLRKDGVEAARALAALPFVHYDFWGDYPHRLRFLNAMVVGFHGDPATFNEKHLALLESNGAKVEPESLYEAQLALRLGGEAPAFIGELQASWTAMRQAPLPAYVPFGAPQSIIATVDDHLAPDHLADGLDGDLEGDNFEFEFIDGDLGELSGSNVAGSCFESVGDN